LIQVWHFQPGKSAVASFEPVFFNNLVMVLDGYFVHRSGTPEGKDGNALNELHFCKTTV